METNLLDRILTGYLESQTPLTLTLQNRIRVSGKIKAFDSYVIIMDGQKREIVYRHAVSCVTASAPEEAKKAPSTAQRQPGPKPGPQSKPMSPEKTRALPAASAPGAEKSINNGMKEGLLKWMQEQKAAK